MEVKLKITNYKELKDDFRYHEKLDYKETFSSTEIYQQLFNEIKDNFDNNNSIQLAYLISYNTLNHADCIFLLINAKRTDDIMIVTYTYNGTIS